MLKIIRLTLIFSLIWLNSAYSDIKPSKSLKFRESTFAEALKLAKNENKLVFLYVYASWCAPCIELKMTTFKNKSVASFYNTAFVNISVNGEKGEGPILARKYGIQAYPSFVFIRPDGTVLYRAEGYFDSSGFLDLGKEVVKISNRK